MIQDKETKVDVKVGDETVKIVVRKPTAPLMSKAQGIAAKAWSVHAREGVMTKKELEKFMKEHGIWDETKDEEEAKKQREIADYEKQLYVRGKNGKLKTSEGRDIAIKMRIARNELRDLIAERIALEQNTAESLADNERFDFLVANCTFRESGEKVYSSLEDYTNEADGEVAFAAASALAQLLYSVDKSFESNLPENRFLQMFDFVDKDLTLVDHDGNLVDTKNRRIDEEGYLLNKDGKRTDLEGNLLDDNGRYVPSVTYTDDKGRKISTSNGQKSKAKVPAEDSV
tara:strand:+ start:355 stop:1212 length:858 start_codon:yes stop_codon:yes gene_type:complete